MTVRQRVLEARLIEKVNKNPQLAKQMGIEIERKQAPEKQNIECKSADTL